MLNEIFRVMGILLQYLINSFIVKFVFIAFCLVELVKFAMSFVKQLCQKWREESFYCYETAEETKQKEINRLLWQFICKSMPFIVLISIFLAK